MQSATLIFESENDIVMHIAVLVRIAMADGKLLDSEKKFMTNTAILYAKAFGTKSFEAMVDECIAGLAKTAVDDWLSIVATHPSEARNLIKDMVALGYVDGDFCSNERDVVYAYSDKLNVPRKVVDEIDLHVFNLIQESKALNQLIAVS